MWALTVSLPMKIYAAPDSIPAPELFKDGELNENYETECEAHEKALVEHCKAESSHSLAGAVVGFPVADGMASYVVYSGTELIHLNVYDGYQFPYIERLTANDIAKKVEQAAAMRALFPPMKLK